MTDNSMQLKVGEQTDNWTYARLDGEYGRVQRNVIDEVSDDSRVGGTVVLDAVDNELRDRITESFEEVDVNELIVQLSLGTYLTEREAEYWALTNLYALGRQELAEEMDASVNTVDEWRQRTADKMAKVARTLDKTGDLLDGELLD